MWAVFHGFMVLSPILVRIGVGFQRKHERVRALAGKPSNAPVGFQTSNPRLGKNPINSFRGLKDELEIQSR
jgi:hypothetical protein